MFSFQGVGVLVEQICSSVSIRINLLWAVVSLKMSFYFSYEDLKMYDHSMLGVRERVSWQLLSHCGKLTVCVCFKRRGRKERAVRQKEGDDELKELFQNI